MFIEYLEPYKRPGLASRFLEECGTSATKLPANVIPTFLIIFIDKNKLNNKFL